MFEKRTFIGKDIIIKVTRKTSSYLLYQVILSTSLTDNTF